MWARTLESNIPTLMPNAQHGEEHPSHQTLILLPLFSTTAADFTSLMQNKVGPWFPALGFEVTRNSLTITQAPGCLVAFPIGRQPRWVKGVLTQAGYKKGRWGF